MGRSLLNMSDNEIYESSLRFIFKQLDLYVESNKQVNNKNNINNKGTKNNKSEETRLKVLD